MLHKRRSGHVRGGRPQNVILCNNGAILMKLRDTEDYKLKPCSQQRYINNWPTTVSYLKMAALEIADNRQSELDFLFVIVERSNLSLMLYSL